MENNLNGLSCQLTVATKPPEREGDRAVNNFRIVSIIECYSFWEQALKASGESSPPSMSLLDGEEECRPSLRMG